MVNLNKSIEKSSSQVVREMCIKGVWKHSDINLNDNIGLDVAVRHKMFVWETFCELLKRPRRFSEMGDLFWQLVAYSDQRAILNGIKKRQRKHFERVISPLALEHPKGVPATLNAEVKAPKPQKRSSSSKKVSAKKSKHGSSSNSKKSTRDSSDKVVQAEKPSAGFSSSSVSNNGVDDEQKEDEAVILGLNADCLSPSALSELDGSDLE